MKCFAIFPEFADYIQQAFKGVGCRVLRRLAKFKFLRDEIGILVSKQQKSRN